MTKLLYIPNGEYLRFFNGCGWQATLVRLEELENLVSKEELPNLTIEALVAYLNDTTDACLEWYEENNLDDKHIFLKHELEIVHD